MEPVDESGRDPELQKLLDALKTEVQKKNWAALARHIGPRFRVDFDYGKGPSAFVRRWKPTLPDSQVWPVLTRLLSMGGTFYSDSLYAAPYVYTRFPLDMDPFSYVVATGEAIPMLKEEGNIDSIAGILRNQIVETAKHYKPPVILPVDGWVLVKGESDETFWVPSRDVYSPAGYRVFFEKQAGRWQWISLACATLSEPPDLLRQQQKKGAAPPKRKQ